MPQFKDVNLAYVYVQDYQAAKEFYRKLLGWPVAWSDDEMGWEENGVEGATHFAINLWDREGPPPQKGATIVFQSTMLPQLRMNCGRVGLNATMCRTFRASLPLGQCMTWMEIGCSLPPTADRDQNSIVNCGSK